MNAWLVIAFLPALVLTVALLNVVSWRRGSPSWDSADQLVSVLIPARNEERNIQKAIESVLASDLAHLVLEVLVLDDQSTDKTRSIVQSISRFESRVRLLAGAPLPKGWIGKPHALSQLAQAARGELLLFLDADVVLKPGGIESMLSLLKGPPHGRVITAMPRQISKTWSERLVLPLLPLTYLSWLPLRLVEWGRDARTVAANGQLLLVSRSTYLALGGFAAVRNEIVDDVAFCRHAKRSGHRVVFADGTEIAECRMYEGPREIVAGFSKNLFEGVGGGFGVVAAISLYWGAFLVPYIALGAALIMTAPPTGLTFAATIGVTANLAIQAILVQRYRQPLMWFLLQPLSIFAFTLIAINSWRWQMRGKITWAGRTYEAIQRRDAPRTTAHVTATPKWEGTRP